jgi:hypothetical protein
VKEERKNETKNKEGKEEWRERNRTGGDEERKKKETYRQQRV